VGCLLRQCHCGRSVKSTTDSCLRNQTMAKKAAPKMAEKKETKAHEKKESKSMQKKEYKKGKC